MFETFVSSLFGHASYICTLYQSVPIIQPINQPIIKISSSMSVTLGETVIYLSANIKLHLSLPFMLHA